MGRGRGPLGLAKAAPLAFQINQLATAWLFCVGVIYSRYPHFAAQLYIVRQCRKIVITYCSYEEKARALVLSLSLSRQRGMPPFFIREKATRASGERASERARCTRAHMNCEHSRRHH